MRRSSVVGVMAAAVCAATGCYATVDPQPVGYGVVTSAPVDIETYPSVVYLGEPVYFYGDHWWHHGEGGRWTYYQNEPEELHRQRDVVLRAPRARVQVRAAPHVETREAPREERHEH